VVRLVFGLLVLTASGVASSDVYAKPASTDAQIRTAMIAESIASYSGSCPCPYHLARNGSSCGKRSAWSRAGGAAPLCFPSDISDEMVRDYRASMP
jgi:hypothetical protein